ncbi:DNA primase [Nocardioides zeae]|uniref:DNA primase n=2 Tax=Nocardioides zeae TaxID=1457234 RepID=A0AAJ1TWB1_9ACTN|nr:DNA primase [Nocardioides zeae]MDQ1103480.1 DNA primase [Nocardioides zeae]MDR6172800.1 DNA primase [Nocardioides zeae]MDR6209810.1 DNA primase [Nocardioides zeae]
MAGKIKDSSIQEVRERARIDEVVGDYVMLRNAGGGSMKGLCPFHDEKSPSFNVTPARQFCHCFGCGKGGDVIWFLQEHDGLGFVEAVERLAERFGVRLEREEGGERDQPGSRGPQRSRLVEVNRVAQEFYAEQLATPAAVEARRFLAERGFDQAAAAHFGLGFAPRDGEAATRHLQGRGFTTDEAVAAGVTAVGRSAYDRFRGRLLWPIRDSSNSTIGFGARRLFDDDRIEAKYLNTPETTLYKKSQVLYGIDLARRDIGRLSQAVIVEGYTDVMACHLAGITTAVATCGTAFGDDHARVLRRFMLDHDEFRGEVVFTFDGDEAGQKAAERAFAGDQNFASQTYVAVEPSGMDPCDLRLAQGDEAVRELIARRVPLYRFVLARILARFDLDRADSRIDALREAAKLVTSVRDRSKVEAFTRELAQMIGVEVDEARAEVRRALARGPQKAPERAAPQHRTEEAAPPQAPKRQLPPLRDPRFAIERETLKLVVQHPGSVGRTIDDVDADDFTHPTYRSVWQLTADAGGVTAGSADPAWVARLRDATTDEVVGRALGELATEPLVGNASPDPAYVNAHVYRLQELTVQRRIADLKSRLQRTNPVDAADDYNRMFGDLMVLEQQRRTLRERAIGG